MPEDYPHSTYDLYQRGLKQLKFGQKEKAMFLLEAVKEREPDSRMLAEILGRTYFSLRFYSRARKEFAQLVCEDPGDDYAHFGLALCYDRLRAKNKARAHYKLATALNPQSKTYRDAFESYLSYGAFYPYQINPN